MNVKGKHTFKVSKQQLWEYLMDPEVLAKITPGVSKLQLIDTDSYQTVSEIKIGPVKGSFKGKLKVVEKDEPSSFAIEMEQLSKIGNAHARVEMNLADVDSTNAELSFDGKAKLSGVIARTGQRVLSGVANTITREVFSSLEKHIEETADDAGITDPAASDQSNADTIEEADKKQTSIAEVNNSSGPEEDQGGFWQSIINFFKRLFS